MPIRRRSNTSSPGPVRVEEHYGTTSFTFPPWLRELCYFGGIVVALTIFGLTLKSDQRSTREELSRLSSDVAAMRASLPNREAGELRLKTLEEKVDRNRSDVDFAIAKLEKFKEDMTRTLAKKGVLD